jgi:fatty acid desaturase
MAFKSEQPPVAERTIIALIVVLLLFVSPLTSFWASLNAPWYSPYLVWALAILLSYLLQRYVARHEL